MKIAVVIVFAESRTTLTILTEYRRRRMSQIERVRYVIP